MTNPVAKPNAEELILQAAHEVFLEKGLAGARMQEIADRAGINKALLHYYFRSKDKLFEMIITRAMGVVMPRLLGVLETDADLFDKIRAFTHEYIGFVSQNRFMPLFIVNEVNRHPQFFFKSMVAHEKPRLDTFRQQVEAAVAGGRIRAISTPQLLMNLMSMVIFPFLGKPVFQVALGLSDDDFEAEMQRRRTDVAEFIIMSLRP
jgi:TetR/AcrR family transcriptional regulator